MFFPDPLQGLHSMQRALRPGILMSPALKHAGQAPRDPIQQILARLMAEADESAWAKMEERLGVFMTADGWIGANEQRLTAG